MISSSSQRSGLHRTLVTFSTVAIAVFALLSLAGGLLAPSASADDEPGVSEPTLDPGDLSQWESCGDSCIEPEFICPPGFSGPSDAGVCTFTGKGDAGPIPELPGGSIECPDGQVVAFDVQLTDEIAALPGPPLDSQFCTEPSADLAFGPGVSCPDGYTGAEVFFPEDEFPLEPTDEEIEALLAAAEAEAPVAGEIPPEAIPTPAPGPIDGPPVEIDYPTCTGPDGDVVGAIVRGIWGPFPYDPGCEGDARAFAGPDGLFCRTADGTVSDIILVPFVPPVCGPDQVETGEPPFTGCIDSTIPAFPICPFGYMPYSEAASIPPICTNDEDLIGQIVALPAPEAGGIANAEEAAADAAEAAADEDYTSYPSYPSCPDFAQLDDGTCANIIFGDGSGDTSGTNPVIPISGGTVVQQPVTVTQPAAVVQPVFHTPVVTHAASAFGFGASLPSSHTAAAATTKKAAELAHTGTETTTFLYVALSMIAAGAVAMGSRRRSEIV